MRKLITVGLLLASMAFAQTPTPTTPAPQKVERANKGKALEAVLASLPDDAKATLQALIAARQGLRTEREALKTEHKALKAQAKAAVEAALAAGKTKEEAKAAARAAISGAQAALKTKAEALKAKSEDVRNQFVAFAQAHPEAARLVHPPKPEGERSLNGPEGKGHKDAPKDDHKEGKGPKEGPKEGKGGKR